MINHATFARSRNTRRTATVETVFSPESHSQATANLKGKGVLQTAPSGGLFPLSLVMLYTIGDLNGLA